MIYGTSESLCQSQQHSVKCDVAAEILRSFGSLRLRVTGHSMLPSIWPGDTLVVERRSFVRIVPDDIVLYFREGRLFAHRVIRIIDASGNARLITQGDALPKKDAPVSSAELLGRVSEIIRGSRHVHPPTMPTVAKRCMAYVLRHCESLSRLLVHLHINLPKREGSCHI
jgi:hypothetical protein